MRHVKMLCIPAVAPRTDEPHAAGISWSPFLPQADLTCSTRSNCAGALRDAEYASRNPKPANSWAELEHDLPHVY